MRLPVLILFVVYTSVVAAQEYRFHQYRVEQGLPSDVIKSVTQDSLGFLWIATDDGLVKYDGARFTTYKNAFRSQYAKGFLHTRDGRLLAFADLDVVEIQNQVDTVIFRSVLRGQRYLSDSTMWFPKAMYEDLKGELWIAEPRSVIRFRNNTFTRYDFGDANRSPVFVRSFVFFEDELENLYAISFIGNIFRFDREKDQFVPQTDLRLPHEVSQVLFINDQLFIAARQGLFVSQVKDGKIMTPSNLFPIRSVSSLLLAADSSIFVSTYAEDLYKISLKNGFQWDNLYFNFNGIHSCFISDESDIWVATDKGLVLIQRNLFTLADINSQSQFVEGIAEDTARNTIYYANKESLVSITPGSDGDLNRKVIIEESQNYFQSLAISKRGLFASSSWNVMLIKDDKIVRKWDFASEGNFIHHIMVDSDDNVWLSQAGSSYIHRIDESMQSTHFTVQDLRQSDINFTAEGKDGIYAVADGSNSFLYFKARTSDKFINISPAVSFEVRGDFTVSSLAIQDDVLWLASSEGLLMWKDEKLSRVEFGEGFDQYPVSSVEVLDEKNILFSNSFGLFRYDVESHEYWLYDENSGLPSNTITSQGIFVSANKDVWIGTSYGLAFATRPLTETHRTRKPYCVDARVNGTSQRFNDGVRSPYGGFITLEFSPISFPENKINFQYRFRENEAWTSVPNRQINLNNLEPGDHVIMVRAKKNTGLGWSDPTYLPIQVAFPYWQKVEFIFLIVMVIILIAWASYAISSAIMNQRKKYLEEQIRERTHELQRANDELIVRNTELDRFVYSASHDLSAPLKSILGLIVVSKLDNPGKSHEQYLNMMERSVHKLEDFIEEVVTYSRNTRMPVKMESFIFKDFVENILLDHQYSENFKYIRFVIDDYIQGPMLSDVTRIKIILNNLLSNAIKFHWIDKGREPYIRISAERLPDKYRIKVEDNGRGIRQEHMDHIFEMFYRATDEAQGSGLGLYILKEAVVKLGGTVLATSVIDSGTTFIIELPATEET